MQQDQLRWPPSLVWQVGLWVGLSCAAFGTAAPTAAQANPVNRYRSALSSQNQPTPRPQAPSGAMARASARLEFRLQLAGTEEAFIRNYQQLQQHQSATAPDAAAPDPMAAAQPATARRSPSVDQIHQALLNLYGGVALDNRDVSDVWIEAAPKGSAPASAPASPAPSSSAAQSRKPEAMPVTLMVKFTQSGSQKFAQATQLLAGTGLTLGIFVDGHLVSAPVVAADYAETGVTGGLASITGTFTPQQTETLITQIKSAK